jgi:GTPase SAR1 family protein
VIVGDGAIGKTSMLISYFYDNFPEEYVLTYFEITYGANRVTKVAGKPITLNFLDCKMSIEYLEL